MVSVLGSDEDEDELLEDELLLEDGGVELPVVGGVDEVGTDGVETGGGVGMFIFATADDAADAADAAVDAACCAA